MTAAAVAASSAASLTVYGNLDKCFYECTEYEVTSANSDDVSDFLVDANFHYSFIKYK